MCSFVGGLSPPPALSLSHLVNRLIVSQQTFLLLFLLLPLSSFPLGSFLVTLFFTTRVTRLGEFSPLGAIVSYGHFLKNYIHK
jgi:hypothetical protein